jgi:hypothetical protein
MKEKQSNHFFAFALIIVGVLLIMRTFDLPFLDNFDLGYVIGLLWPLFILVPGINSLRNRINLGGLILTFLGANFLIENFLDLYEINFNPWWIMQYILPIILIYAGFKVLTQSNHSYEEYDEYKDIQDDGTEASHSITFNSKKFIYDHDNMNDGITRLDLNITFGGAEVFVADDIQVILIGKYSFGGHEFFGADSGGISSGIKETRYPENTSDFYDKTLIIHSNITFGGLEIRRK